MDFRKIWCFLGITFVFSWALWLPEAFLEADYWTPSESIKASFLSLASYGAWGPFVGAFVTIWVFEGRSKMWDLFKTAFKWRMNRMAWLAVIMLPTLIGGALLLYVIVTGKNVALPLLENLPHLFIAFIFILILGGPLQEEFGWRGFLFRNLEEKWTSLGAGAFAGLIWGLWHIPLFFIEREEYYYNKPMWGLMLTTILVGIILAWMYKRSGYSMLTVLIGHAMFNWSNYLFPTLSYDLASLILFVLYFVVIGIILLKYNWKDFTLKQKSAPEIKTSQTIIDLTSKT